MEAESKLQLELGLFAYTPLPPPPPRPCYWGVDAENFRATRPIDFPVTLVFPFSVQKKTSESFCVQKWRLFKADFKRRGWPLESTLAIFRHPSQVKLFILLPKVSNHVWCKDLALYTYFWSYMTVFLLIIQVAYKTFFTKYFWNLAKHK